MIGLGLCIRGKWGKDLLCYQGPVRREMNILKKAVPALIEISCLCLNLMKDRPFKGKLDEVQLLIWLHFATAIKLKKNNKKNLLFPERYFEISNTNFLCINLMLFPGRELRGFIFQAFTLKVGKQDGFCGRITTSLINIPRKLRSQLQLTVCWYTNLK